MLNRADYRLSRYTVISPDFRAGQTASRERIVFATRTATVRVLAEDTWDDIRQGRIDALPTTVFEDLVHVELLVSADEDELATISSRNRQAIASETVLRAVVHPTAHCQLGCDYCGQEHSLAWLSSFHQERLTTEISARLGRKNYQHLAVCWFGAEPLAGMAVIRSLTPRLRQAAASRECSYGAAMITNGVALTPSLAEELVYECGLEEVAITLDGPRDVHDTRRMRKDGTPTYDRITANLRHVASLPNSPLRIVVRMNVDQRNAGAVVPLLHDLADMGLTDKVSFYTAPVHTWGDNDAGDLALRPVDYAAREVEWLTEMMALGFRPGLLPHRVEAPCIAVADDTIVVDAHGEVYNCTEASYVSGYGSPNRFATGHLGQVVVRPTRTTTIAKKNSAETCEDAPRRQALASFPERVANGEYPCSSCSLLPVCGGACPKAWLEGRLPCPSSKWNADARLLLWYTAHVTACIESGH